MEKTIAVVVTYNRLILLKECIKALRCQTQQPDAILVVNNGSTDDTELWLQIQDNIHFVTQKNTGSGGGFKTAIEWAYKNGYSWIWCMDDDGYPKADAFENLLKPELDRLYLRNCAVIDKADKKSFVWKTKGYANIEVVDKNIIEGVGHPFNGTLLHRNIVERVGLPRQRYFMWGDESEYFYRITQKNKIPVCTVASSIHYHPAAGFSYKNDWDYGKAWKMYFYIRNRFHVNQSRCSNKVSAFINYCAFLVAMVGIVLIYQKTDKLKKVSFLFWPAADAFTNNFDANPSLILTRLSAASPFSIPAISSYVKNSAVSILSIFSFTSDARKTAGLR